MLKNIRLYLLVIIGLTWSTNASTKNDKNFQTVQTSNEAIFNRLGLSPLEISDGHYKKRLAGPEPSTSLVNLQTRINQPYNRRHGDHDSHVYIVKLPPSQPYYTITKPHKKLINDNENANIHNEKLSSIIINHEIPTIGFNSNGKTAKIYHWNLPLMKEINKKKRHNELFKIQQMKKKLTSDKKQLTQLSLNNVNVFDDKLPPLKKHARNNDKRLNYPSKNNIKINNDLFDNNYSKNNNDTQKKMLRLDDSTFYNIKSNNNNNIENFLNDFNSMKNIESFETKKHRKKAAMSYYAPNIHKTGSTSIYKNFPGNGKPKAFYVMEKSRKPVYYHPLLP
ncbi:hypothetical protein HCN44_002539 [Aphidius gifuensis]|uniref:Uncharacterized protein n=1 Tax=Aphidius gifuensis TaxID=684658 RepID=A0A834Y3N6_APHGI|nr:probable basic-leucine zipper transcription factor G [Aphidius gifuensis]KAF7996893.1 hypothetical protein HCN44_002539 [Aphidius gifuensis]